jgi:multiple sugar transport system ATP-binding protein
VPPQLTNRTGNYAGKEVTLGVRPEDLRVASDADPTDMSLEAAVEVVERLGSEILLDVAVGGTTMVAAVEPTVTAKVHEKLRLAVNPNRLHFFDSENEAAI